MIAANLEIGPGREAGVAQGVWEIELSALRRATKLVEKVQVLNTPWPASMYLGTALDALKAAERLIENGNGDDWGSSG